VSLFTCESCGVRDNTALTRYWLRNESDSGLNGRALCSQCDPAIGKWHGLFDRDYSPLASDG
jgi:hypothetical protein